MQAKLIEFKPLLYNNQHSKWNDFWKFIVVLDNNGNTIEGEAMAKSQNGSKVWNIGQMHTFEMVDAEKAHGGKNIKSLKVVQKETAPADSFKSSQLHDMEKEAYVISRFSHSFALDYMQKADQVDIAKLKEEFGRELISKFAQSIADSVFTVARSIIDKNAKFEQTA